MEVNENRKLVKLYSPKKTVIKFFALALLFSFIFQKLWIGLVLGGFMTFLFMMFYAAKVVLSDTELCVQFFLRPFYKPKCYQFELIEKIVFHEQEAAGSSDIIEINLKSNKKSKHYLYFSDEDLDTIINGIDGRVKFILPKSRQPSKYR